MNFKNLLFQFKRFFSRKKPFLEHEMHLMNQQLKFILKDQEKRIKDLKYLYDEILPQKIPTIPNFNFSTRYKSGLGNLKDYFTIVPVNKKDFLLFATSCGQHKILLHTMDSFAKWLDQKIFSLEKEPWEDFIMSLFPLLKEESSNKQAMTNSIHLCLCYFEVSQKRLSTFSVGDFLVYRFQDQIDWMGKAPFPAFNQENQASFDKKALKNRIFEAELKSKDRFAILSPGAHYCNDKEKSISQDEILSVFLNSHQKSIHDLKNELLFLSETKLEKEKSVYVDDCTVIALECNLPALMIRK